MFALLPLLSLFAVASAQDASSASASDVAVVEAKFEGESVPLHTLGEELTTRRPARSSVPPFFYARGPLVHELQRTVGRHWCFARAEW
jgi:hypothetical protein